MAFKNAKIYGQFYSPEKVLSYGRPWILITGSRSIGKSTGVGMEVIENYIKTGMKFIYIRRTEDEVMATCRSFFENPIKILQYHNKYNIEDFKYDKKDFFIKIDGKWSKCGTTVPLSLEHKYKSTNFSEYNRMLYDEFICLDTTKYLGSKANPTYEFDRCLSLYQTVDRGIGRMFRNETIFYFLANNSSYFNPIYLALHIDEYLRTDTKICAPKGKQWVVEQVEGIELSKDIKESFAYQLADEKNRDYAYQNIAVDSEMQFVEKINAPMVPIINLSFNKHRMGVYLYRAMGIIYISDKTNNLGTLALTCKDQDKVNYMMALKYRDDSRMQTIKQAYYSGNIRFETNKCKYDIANYFLLTP